MNEHQDAWNLKKQDGVMWKELVSSNGREDSYGRGDAN